MILFNVLHQNLNLIFRFNLKIRRIHSQLHFECNKQLKLEKFEIKLITCKEKKHIKLITYFVYFKFIKCNYIIKDEKDTKCKTSLAIKCIF